MSNHDACPRMSIPRFADSPADVLRREINRAAERHGDMIAEMRAKAEAQRAERDTAAAQAEASFAAYRPQAAE